jgi:CheY-like chemotaxis protein
MNSYVLPLENILAVVREAWGASLFPLLIGMALLVLLLMLVVDGGGIRRRSRGLPDVDEEEDTETDVDEIAADARASQSMPRPAHGPLQGQAAGHGGAGEPVRVLVVDDSAVVRLKLRRLLERAGYTVGVAGNGLEALDALARAFYSVLVTDLEMPEMSGLELIASVHGSLETEDLPIIAITGHDELQSRVHDYAGLYGLFRKPWNDRELLKRIEALAPLRSGKIGGPPAPATAPPLPITSPLAGA